ncbi:unnamed protein product, partial [marine sediment metagenome]
CLILIQSASFNKPVSFMVHSLKPGNNYETHLSDKWQVEKRMLTTKCTLAGDPFKWYPNNYHPSMKAGHLDRNHLAQIGSK